MKLRILNGGHATIACPAALMDIHFVHEAMENPLVRAFLAKVEQSDGFRYVKEVDWDKDAYVVTYYTSDKAKVEITYDPVTAEPK